MNTVEEIYRQLLDGYGEKTGIQPREGCDLSARLYALAAQVGALYVQADWVARQAFPQTAQGEYLDRHAQLRSLERKGAVAARGVVRFTAGQAPAQELAIPAGTVCMTAGLVRFETVQPGVIPAGETWADIPVQALEPGAAGNVGAGTILSMAVAPAGISGCTNPQPCAGGADEEGDEALRGRVLDTFRRLPNGANAAFYEQGALSFDQVAAASVVPRPRGTGTVDVVVSTRTGLPDAGLLSQLQDYFEQRREIAVEVQVRAPQTLEVELSVQVQAQEGWDGAAVRAGVEQALQSWFDGRLLGQDILRAKLGSLIYDCDGVANYTITAPAADVAVAGDVLPMLGGLTVEEMA